ncbi:MAG: acetyl-CoA carboxylase biotin carboxyl carrier protein [Eubacterium sp.]|nr:acetyl-CoA carboxylase biotin carboxyl carrier protein [Eubacterium sp.]
MDFKEIEGLMDRFEKNSLTELEIVSGDLKVRFKKETAVGAPAASPVSNTSSASADIAPGNIAQGYTSSDEAGESDGAVEVKSPVPGTFYAASAPDKAPYVKEGQVVKKGDVLGLIEAMKIMNEIPSPVDGIVSAIHVVDGDFVGYEDVLISIREAEAGV